jgi:glycosyltransferase involved in cell wall biosynthesis
MEERRKVLIITYYWPPAGGITVLRCLKIAKYLRDFGWEPVIYTASNAQYPYLDCANERDIPDGVEVLSQPIFEPLHLFKKLSGRKASDPLTNVVHVRDQKAKLADRLGIWVRANFFIPDARAFWIRPSVRYLTEYLKHHPVDAIFSDGPPHTNTAIACELKKASGVPWLADFQDPWTQVDYYPLLGIKGRADRKHRAMEQDVFETASAMTIASPSWKTDLESIGAKNVDVLYYGYDEADFEDIEPVKNDMFTIVHTGLLGFDRRPDPLIQALSELKNESPDRVRKLQVVQYGELDFSVKQRFEEAGVGELLHIGGIIPRKEALKALVSAGLLLLPLNKAENAKGRMPGKFYEYLRAGRPILALGPDDSDVAHILQDTRHGRMHDYSDVEGTKQTLLEALQAWERGDRFASSERIRQFSNREQTRVVANVLDRITAS